MLRSDPDDSVRILDQRGGDGGERCGGDGFDFSAGDGYWQRSGGFWRDVRAAWAAVYAERAAFEYLEEVDGQEMFVPLFEYADKLDNGEPYDAAAAADVIRRTFAAHLR